MNIRVHVASSSLKKVYQAFAVLFALTAFALASFLERPVRPELRSLEMFIQSERTGVCHVHDTQMTWQIVPDAAFAGDFWLRHFRRSVDRLPVWNWESLLLRQRPGSAAPAKM